MDSSAVVSTLLENQRLLNEKPSTDIAQFKRISIPLVRRIYPQLIASTLCSVQPMMQPQADPVENRVRVPRHRSIDDPWETSKDVW